MQTSRSSTFDYIIVGQGMAGSSVAVQLLLRKKRILVIDSPHKNVSSLVAAGIFNPVAGKKMAKTWMADKLFPSLHVFYRMVEDVTHEKFFYSLPVYRPFVTVAEQNEWMAASSEEGISSFIKEVFTTPQYSQVLHDLYGGLLLHMSGYVDMQQYLGAVRRWIEKEGTVLDETFLEEKLTIEEHQITYQSFRAPKIVFCNGVQSLSSTLWKWAPIRPLKGEMFEIKGNLIEDALVNSGVYLVPGGPGRWKVGATYEHDFQDIRPSEGGRVELMNKLQGLIKAPFEVLHHYAGVRPTTPDRKPLMGEHPGFKNVLIFNGLGTKGVSLSPYFSDHFIRSLENQTVLNKEVDISRYKSLYWNSR